MKKKMTVLLGVLFLLSATAAYGQEATEVQVKAPIDFAFTVEGKVLPAGQYELTRIEDAFRVQGVGKEAKDWALAPIITRLSGEMREKKMDTYLVFDVVGNVSTLSEIWLPGEDGYLVGVVKAKHMHKVMYMK